MSEKGICALCDGECTLNSRFESSLEHYDCPTCGRYEITREDREDSKELADRLKKMRLAACTREWTIRMPLAKPLRLCLGEPQSPGSENSRSISYVLNELFPRRVQERFDRALLNLCALTEYPGWRIRWDTNLDFTALMAETQETGLFVLRELEALGHVTLHHGDDSQHRHRMFVVVSGAGLRRASEIEDALGREQSKQVFVAMSFAGEMNQVYDEGIAPAIVECGFDSFRVDTKETNNSITDEIIAEIRRSRFLVSDFTRQRGGVYFEAGFALGLGLPVIWMCKEDDLSNVHFDTRQYSHIVWTHPEDLQAKLRNRILATIPGARPRGPS